MPEMKAPPIIHLVWMLVAVIVFAVGYSLTNHRGAQRAATQSSGSPQSLEKTSIAAPKKAESQREVGGTSVVVTAEQVRIHAFEILGVSNRVKRLRQLCELLEQVTPHNWQGIIDAFTTQATEEGRVRPDEWKLMLEHVGAVAGAAAIREALTRGLRAELGADLFTGWAMGNPKAAIEWLQGQPIEMQEELFNYLLAGVGKSDPKQALTLLVGQPQEVWESNMAAIIDGAIQLGGFRGAEELYAGIRARADIPSPAKGNVFYELAQRKIAIAAARGDPAETLVWLDGYLSDAGPFATMQMIRSAAAADLPGTVAWLEERVNRMGPAQLQRAYNAVAETWQAQAPEEFIAWVEAHPDHSQHDAMAEMGTGYLLRTGKVEEARRVANTIGDAAIRARLETTMQRFNAARKAQSQTQ